MNDDVCFISGRLLGKVVQVADGSFGVQADDGTLAWLRREAVFTRMARRVTLICEREGLRRYSPFEQRPDDGAGAAG
ncbi:MAG: hypothetical protein ACM3S1_16910 [Hyphomicrobiales bacterium]